MAKIHSPVKGFIGSVVGVAFDNGLGETTDENLIGYFTRKGYKVEPDAKGPAKGTKGAKVAEPEEAEAPAAEEVEAE
jgi:hypothetical protein